MAQVVLVILLTWLGSVMPSSAGSQPVCVPPAEGISAWFPGDDTRDVFGNAPGVLIGEAQIVPGFRGNAFEFDGLNDSVSHAPDPLGGMFGRCARILQCLKGQPGEAWPDPVAGE